jgi:hypothetical protein
MGAEREGFGPPVFTKGAAAMVFGMNPAEVEFLHGLLIGSGAFVVIVVWLYILWGVS